jgi:protein SERAC1
VGAEKLEQFRFREMFLRQLAIGAPADNTCHWLADTQPCTAWTERSDVAVHHGLLQITGKPGSGKSTLMKTTFEATRSLSQSVYGKGTCVIGHFFDRRGQPLEHSASGMFRSLLYQIGNLHPACLAVFKEYTQGGLQLLESIDAISYGNFLKSHLEKLLSDPRLAPSRTIIFIDALDECDASVAAQTGYYFAQLTHSAYKAGVPLDVCISRREYPSITVRNCLEIHIEAHNAHDIRDYIGQKMELSDVALTESRLLQEAIAERSEGIFLWVVLAVEGVLGDFENGKNARYILKRIGALPKALEDLFAQTLERMQPDDIMTALLLFQWAVLATERLRIHEWHHILALIRGRPLTSLKAWKGSEHHTETDIQLQRQIRDLSQGLIEVRRGVTLTETVEDTESLLTGSLLAGAGSLDSTTGDTRVVQAIHETVAEFFISGHANRLFGKPSTYDISATVTSPSRATAWITSI